VLDRRLQSLEPIYSLAPTLEALQLVATHPSLVLDLGRFPALTGLSADWGQVKASFAEASGLEDVFLGSYSERDLEPLTSAPRLTRLVMKDRPGLRSLNGLAGLPALTELGIYLALQLTDVTNLQAAPRLTELHLEACRKIPTLDQLATLRALELLNVSDSGDFPDVEALGSLIDLRDLLLYGTTKVLSGDLSPIAGLPELRQFRMQNRRHYVPSVPDIEQAVALRRGSR
jgi:internalin A